MHFEIHSYPSSDSLFAEHLGILEAGYDRNLNREKTRNLLERATAVVKARCSKIGEVAGLAVLCEQETDRMMMVCGLPTAESRRCDGFSATIEFCVNEGLAAWMSVGRDSKRVIQLCNDSGMQQLKDSAAVLELIEPLHRLPPIIEFDQDGFVIAKGAQNSTGRGQYIFRAAP
jgi:hypothetical protein